MSNSHIRKLVYATAVTAIDSPKTKLYDTAIFLIVPELA